MKEYVYNNKEGNVSELWCNAGQVSLMEQVISKCSLLINWVMFDHDLDLHDQDTLHQLNAHIKYITDLIVSKHEYNKLWNNHFIIINAYVLSVIRSTKQCMISSESSKVLLVDNMTIDFQNRMYMFTYEFL